MGKGDGHMLHIVQFSGGAASSYVGYLVAKEHPDNTILLFHDTKAEHPDAYRFRKQVSEYIGLPITEMSDGRDLWEVIDDNNALPSQFIPFCTRILKQEQCDKFLKSLDDDFILYNGFGPDEWQRVQKATVRGEILNRVIKSPLFERGITDNEVKRIIRDEWKICLPEPYQHLKHNNCIPCFKATAFGYWQKLWKYYPDAYRKAIEYEEKIGYTVLKDMSLTELENMFRVNDRQIELDFGNDGIPCMCAV